ncbi:MAG: hydantoinase B/oxoprolinase family protein [Solirubrobacteraceae bacterium]
MNELVGSLDADSRTGTHIGTGSEPDPITIEIIQASLQAIGDEMFAALRKTAMSAIIYEVLDAGSAICDRDGNLASAGAGIPTFVAVLDKAVKRIIELRGLDAIHSGDIYITNDPFYGGVTHLNDIVLCLPVFVDDRLIAWTATIAHFNDVGGMVAGSISAEASEIFQEGLRLPAVKLVDRGEPITAVFEIMRVNSRLPDFMRGDLWAEIACVRLGERRLIEIAGKYGTGVFLTAIQRLLEHGEQVMQRALAELPTGRYEHAEEQDNGTIYRVAIEMTGTEFIVDMRGNPPQDKGSANVSRDGALIAAQVALMNIAAIKGSANAGHFTPLRLITEPGTVFDPGGTAACSIYSEGRIRMSDLILQCVAPYLGERLPAGGFTSVCGTFISGPHVDNGRQFTIVEPQLGGWGASAWKDGNDAMFTMFHGNTFNCPAEIAEARYGLLVDRLALAQEAGGEGRFRGGSGIVLEYRVRGEGLSFTCAYTRSKHPPWPLHAGVAGTANYTEVVRGDGSVERYSIVTGVPLSPGDVIRIHTGHGAGYGDPHDRARELVEADLRDGLVEPERARQVYGYVS